MLEPAPPPEDADAAQARIFIAMLIEHIGKLSLAIKARERHAESARRQNKTRIAARAQERAADLRAELRDIERQIDMLRLRFPPG